MSESPVRYELNDGVAAITIDRPEARNALNRSVDTRTLVFNLFSLYFNFQYLWLAADMPPRHRIDPTLRERLAVQLGVLQPHK
jgi:hypothetical protein